MIKHCPFCGAHETKILENSGSYGYTPNKFTIKCASCGASLCLYDDFNLTKTEATSELIKMWNRRTNEK